MTDREIIALMAASIWPAIDNSNSTLTSRELAVNVARDLLREVDRQMPDRGDENRT